MTITAPSRSALIEDRQIERTAHPGRTIIANNRQAVIEGELFAQIPGYEGLYEASNLGRIRSSYKQVQCVVQGRPHIRAVPGRVMAQFYTSFGYLSIKLLKDGKRRAHRVNRLVLQAFVGGGENLDANHLNGVVTDNRLCNLEWATRHENMLHYWEVLGGPRKRPANTKLSDEQVAELLQLRESGDKILVLATKFGISTSQAQRIVTRQQRIRPRDHWGRQNEA